MESAQPLLIRSPDPKADHDELMDLIAKTFSTGRGYFGFRDYCIRDGYMDTSHYNWADSRIGIMDGRIVTHFGVWDYQMRVGRSALRVAGIGVVATHGDYRKRGLMDITARACVDAMPQAGYDQTILFGIPDYYHKFGYVPAWPAAVYTAAIVNLPDARPPSLRPLPASTAAMDRLYNRHAAGMTGTAIRPTYSRNRNPRKWHGWCWGGRGESMEGYVLVGDVTGGRMDVLEAVGHTPTALAAARSLAASGGACDVSFIALHWHSPVARWLRSAKCRLELRFTRSGEAMVRTVNLETTLRKLAPELGRRLGRSHMAGWRGSLLVADARQRVELRIGNGIGVSAAGRPAGPHRISGGEEVAQLIIGNGEPREVMAAAAIRTRGDGAQLAEVLFPNQHPQLAAWDAF
jgi:hypothetical protein